MTLRDPNDPAFLFEEQKNAAPWVSMGPSEEDLARIVADQPYDHLSPEDRALAYDSLGRHLGGMRVQAVDVRHNPKDR